MSELNVFPDKVPDPITNSPQIDMGGGITPSELEQLKQERLDLLKKRDEENAKKEAELLAEIKKNEVNIPKPIVKAPVINPIVPNTPIIPFVQVKRKRREKDLLAPFDLVPIPSKGLMNSTIPTSQ